MDFGGLRATFGMIWCLWSSFGEDFGDERHQDQIFGRQEREKERKKSQLGRVWEHLGSIWIAIGGSWEDLGASRGCLEGVLGGVFEVLREFLVDIVFFRDFIMIFFNFLQ